MPSQINNEALNQARKLIQRDLGDVNDLPEELRNTVVNNYYQFSCIDLELNRGPNYIPAAGGGSFSARVEKFCKDAARYQTAVKYLPDIIGAMRRMKKDGEIRGYELCVSLALYMFKYNIPKADEKSSIRLAIERPFYSAKVREIADLWKRF